MREPFLLWGPDTYGSREAQIRLKDSDIGLRVSSRYVDSKVGMEAAAKLLEAKRSKPSDGGKAGLLAAEELGIELIEEAATYYAKLAQRMRAHLTEDSGGETA